VKGFYAGAGVALAALLYMTWQWRPETAAVGTFYGIVDTTETVVSAELPVEIRNMRVNPGQIVREGDTLVELESAELERNIAELRRNLSQVRASRQAEDREIQAKVSELEAQYRLNRSLLSQVRGSEGGNSKAQGGEEKDDASPLQAAIVGLKGMLAREGVATGDMEAYLALLLRERDKLTVVASGSGVIGTVYCREGENVKAFEPILTQHTGSPSTVRGYLHESIHGLLEPGSMVRVRSLASAYEVVGEVVGVGHRIVEYPVRLRKRPDVQVWGREVTVRIPAANAFLLGEKVMLRAEPRRDGVAGEGNSGSEHSLLPALSAHAAEPGPSGAPWRLPGIEASGLVFVPALSGFLVVSDDTPHKAPWLFYVDAAGRPGDTLRVEGLGEVNDLESIALDAEGRLFLATSQSRNKHGKFPASRRLLMRASREGKGYRLDASIDLHAALEAFARLVANDAKGDWAEWLRAAVAGRNLDMEGIALEGKGLLLGFKAPLWQGRAVILRVHDRDALMAGKPIPADGLSLWSAPGLPLPGSGAACGISDLLYRDGRLHVLGTAVSEDASDGVLGGGGAWWVLDTPTSSPRLIRSFAGLKPEGIAFDPAANLYRIAFDEGSKRPALVQAVRPSGL
jgi:multidrug resistance efflux pump